LIQGDYKAAGVFPESSERSIRISFRKAQSFKRSAVGFKSIVLLAGFWRATIEVLFLNVQMKTKLFFANAL